MGEATKIQWTHHTFNPWIGCTKVHAGCTNCYAEADMDKRRGRVKWGPSGTRSKTSAANWREPLKWNKEAEAAGERRRVFCASLADVFEDWDGPIVDHKGTVLLRDYGAGSTGQIAADGNAGRQHKDWTDLTMDDLRRDLFRLIDRTPWLDWLLLTKRPENVRQFWSGILEDFGSGRAVSYRSNVWIGTSVSNQETADKQIPDLLKCRDLASVLFLSAEPLLGPISLAAWGDPIGLEYVEQIPCALSGGSPIDWVIIGGESGSHARPCDAEWMRWLVGECRAFGISVFVKQLGAVTVDSAFCERDGTPGILLGIKDKKGGDPEEWPEDLRVREFPKVVV